MQKNKSKTKITAVPKERIDIDTLAADPDLSPPFEYGKMNPEDAKESGYTDSEGKAVSKSRKDLPGSPTGAYTDVGAGRSSAVRPARHKNSKNPH